MRDLVFKNLTSNQKGRKVLCTYEKMEQGGVLTRIKRSFVYIIKNAHDSQAKKLYTPHLYILKIKDTHVNKEKFLCRIKGSIHIVNDSKLYLVAFSHSLSIDLTPVPPKTATSETK